LLKKGDDLLLNAVPTTIIYDRGVQFVVKVGHASAFFLERPTTTSSTTTTTTSTTDLCIKASPSPSA